MQCLLVTNWKARQSIHWQIRQINNCIRSNKSNGIILKHRCCALDWKNVVITYAWTNHPQPSIPMIKVKCKDHSAPLTIQLWQKRFIVLCPSGCTTTSRKSWKRKSKTSGQRKWRPKSPNFVAFKGHLLPSASMGMPMASIQMSWPSLLGTRTSSDTKWSKKTVAQT